jgi:hypothetical protein
MHAGGVRNFADDFTGVGVGNDNFGRVRHVQSVCLWIDDHVVPTTFTPDLDLFHHAIIRVRRLQEHAAGEACEQG